jgi:hypothetical protein
MAEAQVELRLLDRIRRSPYAGGWLRGGLFRIETGREGWIWSPERVVPDTGEAVDATIHCTADDLGRMVDGQAPVEVVRWTLGKRDGAPRIKQSRAMLAASALGWMGPLPDPAAPDSLQIELRRACMELALGPCDALRPLFPSEAPQELSGLALRFTDGARRSWATVGLSEPAGIELWTHLSPRALRAVAITRLESGTLPTVLELDGTCIAFRARPLPLARAIAALVEVVQR